MKQQKWSGVKLTEKEKNDIKREEKFEIIVDIIAFFFILGFLVFGVIAICFIKGLFK